MARAADLALAADLGQTFTLAAALAAAAAMADRGRAAIEPVLAAALAELAAGARWGRGGLYVAALLELAALGWYVTAIRPNRAAPVLWRVTIVRYDLSAWITATDADPDDAFDELIRYAAADAEGLRGPAPAAASDEGKEDPQ